MGSDHALAQIGLGKADPESCGFSQDCHDSPASLVVSLLKEPWCLGTLLCPKPNSTVNKEGSSHSRAILVSPNLLSASCGFVTG